MNDLTFRQYLIGKALSGCAVRTTAAPVDLAKRAISIADAAISEAARGDGRSDPRAVKNSSTNGRGK